MAASSNSSLSGSSVSSGVQDEIIPEIKHFAGDERE